MSWGLDRTNFDRNIAVVIGINNYGNGIHPLKTAVNDARAISDLLEQEYKYQQVIRLFSEHGEATLAEINKLLFKTLPNEVKLTEGDRLLFYFAGHGIARNSEDGPAGYLIPQDAQLGKLETFLPMRDLNTALSQLECHHLLVMLDCCFAGNFRWSSSRNVISALETIHREHYDRFIRHPAWQAITSAAYNQEAIDFLTDQRGIVEFKNKQHSPFATALIEALQEMKADLTKDGLITAPELYIYLRDEVEKASSESQTPGLWPLHQHDRGEYIFTPLNFNPEELKPAPKPNENNNPYRGLKPFEEKHSRFFFGRDELVQQLYDKVATPDQVFTVVLGISGSGKSSLVKAGLIPLLRQKSKLEKSEVTLANQWEILAPMRPGESPFLSLARTILPIANVSVPTELAELDFITEIVPEKIKLLEIEIANSTKENGKESQQTQLLQEEKENFSQIAETWNSDNQPAKLLLLIQHFEEFYALCKNPEKQESEPQIQESSQQKLLKQTFLATLNPLSQRLQSEPNYFIEIVTDWSQQHPGFKLLLLIDQFEELITLCPPTTGQNKQDNKPQEWQLFLNLLEITLAANLPQLRIVVTLRSDFEPRFLNSDALKSYWSKARFPVRAMRSDELRQAIERPASEMALYFEPPNLVDRLIDEVGQMPGALPLLSFTLSELYLKLAEKWRKEETSDRALTIDAEFDRQGGVAGCLTRRANQEYKKIGDELGETAQSTMRRLMLRMLTLEGGETARRRVPESELVYPNQEESDRVKQVVERLVEARLLVKGQLETGEPFVEPAHDFLIRGWNQLQEWIKQSQEDLALQQRLTPAANDWLIGKGGLWTRELDRLTRLEEILKSKDNNWLNKLEVEFVETSKQKRFDELKEAERQRDEAIQGQISTLNSLSEARLLANDQLGALVASVKAGKQLSSSPISVRKTLDRETIITLRQTFSQLQELNRFQGHTGLIWDIIFCSDGNRLVSAGYDKVIKLWDVTGRIIHTFPGHSSDVFSVTVSPDGTKLASASYDQTIKLWNLNNGTLLKTLHYHTAPVTSVSFSPDGSLLASCSHDKTIKLWSAEGELLNSFGNHSSVITSVTFSPDSQRLASTSYDNTIKIWNREGKELIPLTGHSEAVMNSCFSPDGLLLASASADKTIKLWDIHKKTFVSFNGHSDTVWGVSFSPDGQLIASASSDGTVKLWKQNGTLVQTFKGHTNMVCNVRFSPQKENQIVASASADGTIRLWSSHSNLVSSYEGHNSWVWSVSFAPDDKVIASGSSDKTVKLWSLDGTLLNTLYGHKALVDCVSFSPDGKLIASGSSDCTIQLWERSGKKIKTLKGHTDRIRGVCFSKDGHLIASTSHDCTIRLWNRNGVFLQTFKGHEAEVIGISFSPTKQLIASCSYDRTVRLWDYGGNLLVTLTGHTDQVIAVSFSTDGKLIASASDDKTVKIWSIDGKLVRTLEGHDGWVMGVCFSPDDRIIASASADRTIKLWNHDGDLISTLQSHDNWVMGVAFDSTGQLLASASADNTVKLWNLQKLESELTLEQLVKRGCSWLHNYLTNNPTISQEDKSLCHEICSEATENA